MATISGKRFQITDGASTPTNLFPYTVTEAVYGLSTVIENAKTAVTSVLSAVTLNGVSKAGTTASFYAPATAGTTGQILKATTSGAPVWTSAALGASNKPIYLNSSGVLTEGVACLPLTGGIMTGAIQIGAYTAFGVASGTFYLGSPEYPVNLRSNGTTQINGNTVWHSGNDGSGSGLDADLFDGLESSSFFISNGNRGAIDFSTNYKTGYEYVSGSATNGSTPYAIMFTTVFGDAGMQVNFGRGNAMSYRNGTPGQWFSWRTVYDTANANLSTVAWACSNLTASGTINSSGDQVVSSDLTLKTNLTPVTYSVSDIAKARAVEFDWKDGRGHSMGSIAQDWLGIAPALVHGEEGSMSLAYGQLALVNTILLARQSESHEERIARLEKENAELKEEVKRLRMN